jgi:hypothetical protein
MAWIGAVIAGLVGLMSLYLGIRKLFEVGHKSKIARLCRTLQDRARCLPPNQPWLSRSTWGAMLGKDSKLISEVIDSLHKDGLVEYASNDYLRIGPKMFA